LERLIPFFSANPRHALGKTATIGSMFATVFKTIVIFLAGLTLVHGAQASENILKPEALAGTWHLRMETASDARFGFLGKIHIQTTTHLLVAISQGPVGLTQTQQICAISSVPSSNISRTILPTAFISHLPKKTYTITVANQGENTWHYTADLGQTFVGYDGTKAPNAIPSKAGHPAVFDWDRDGKPGATVIVDIPILGEVRIYLVQTNHMQLSGSVQSPDHISGKAIQILMDQRTIGADNFLLSGSPNLTVGAGHDGFDLGRIKAGADCTDIVALAKSGT